MERYFNTSGPCNSNKHYTLMRETLLAKGIALVKDERYFTIWAPRQTGKSTYFTLLCDELNQQDYIAIWISTEGFGKDYEKDQVIDILIDIINTELNFYNLSISTDFKSFFQIIKAISLLKKKVCLVIDEIERFTEKYFDEFLHTIRTIYHKRENHNLKSVVLVGVANIVGVIQDNASPFNIADNLDVPYFTKEEVFELLGQHEAETNQKFDDQVKQKIYEITAGQPGLVNGFAYQLVENNQDKELFTVDEYLRVENFYLRKAIDKNLENIKNKAKDKEYRSLLEDLLFNDEDVEYNIHDENTKFLHTQGIIDSDDNNNIKFWVPLYKKILHRFLSPKPNGEKHYFYKNSDPLFLLDQKDKTIKLNELIKLFQEYVKERSLKYFMDRSEDGTYCRLKEAAAGYAFSTFIDSFVRSVGGTIYYESNCGLGRTDITISMYDKRYVIENKIFYDLIRFFAGKKQVAYYAKSYNLNDGYYFVFASKKYNYLKDIKNSFEKEDGIKIYTHIIWYDEDKDFG